MWARPDSIDELLPPRDRDALPGIGSVPSDDSAVALHRISLVTDLPQGAMEYFVLAGGQVGGDFHIETEMRIGIDAVARRTRAIVTLGSLIDIGSDRSFRAIAVDACDGYIFYFTRDRNWCECPIDEISGVQAGAELEVSKDPRAGGL